ncbi:MAG: hypothetical protein HY881_27660 [Deltaproteobacteria bacterium]|nr:hypothetical protein [Deltaproteobacteria bacterium]
MLLEGSLSVFFAALKDILPYAYISSLPYGNESLITPEAENVKDLSIKIINWLKSNPMPILLEDRPSELRRLYDAISLDGEFVKGFNAIFQVDVNYIKNYLEKERSEKDVNNELEFVFDADLKILNSTVLCYINSLLNILVNHTIDPMGNNNAVHKSKIFVYRNNNKDDLSEMMVFRLSTNFDSLEETNRKIFETKRGLRELKNIEIFGAIIHNKEWFVPNDCESSEGFTASWEILIPTGYLSKGE